MTELLTGPTY